MPEQAGLAIGVVICGFGLGATAMAWLQTFFVVPSGARIRNTQFQGSGRRKAEFHLLCSAFHLTQHCVLFMSVAIARIILGGDAGHGRR